MKTDKEPRIDRGEKVFMMEPMRVAETSPHRGFLTDLALELAQKSAGFRRSLPESILASLAHLVRSMNCYYSNLIEGHDTHPVDIERALRDDYSKDARKRNLQLEARAHIAVQEWIDGGGLRGRAVSRGGIQEIHARFCELLPPDLLWVENPETKERVRVVPGELRGRIGEFSVGQLVSLRFASDAELPELARKVLEGKIEDRKAIKQMVKDWQPDWLRA